MINGFSTLGAVALRLADDYSHAGQWRSARYTLDQAVEKVCWRQESIIGEVDTASYLWWSFEIRDGALAIDIDRGKLTEIYTTGKARRWLPARHLDVEALANIAWNDWDSAMLRLGLTLGQRVLTRHICYSSCDTWSDDYREDCKIIYVEPPQEGYLPIRVDLARHNGMTGFRLA